MVFVTKEDYSQGWELGKAQNAGIVISQPHPSCVRLVPGNSGLDFWGNMGFVPPIWANCCIKGLVNPRSQEMFQLEQFTVGVNHPQSGFFKTGVSGSHVHVSRNQGLLPTGANFLEAFPVGLEHTMFWLQRSTHPFHKDYPTGAPERRLLGPRHIVGQTLG